MQQSRNRKQGRRQDNKMEQNRRSQQQKERARYLPTHHLYGSNQSCPGFLLLGMNSCFWELTLPQTSTGTSQSIPAIHPGHVGPCTWSSPCILRQLFWSGYTRHLEVKLPVAPHEIPMISWILTGRQLVSHHVPCFCRYSFQFETLP